MQRFRQPRVWLLLIGIASLIRYLFFLHVIMGTPAGTLPASDAAVLLFTANFGIGFPIFFLVLRLEITVAGERLIFGSIPSRSGPERFCSRRSSMQRRRRITRCGSSADGVGGSGEEAPATLSPGTVGSGFC